MSDFELFPFEETELYKKAYAFAKKCREMAGNPQGDLPFLFLTNATPLIYIMMKQDY